MRTLPLDYHAGDEIVIPFIFDAGVSSFGGAVVDLEIRDVDGDVVRDCRAEGDFTNTFPADGRMLSVLRIPGLQTEDWLGTYFGDVRIWKPGVLESDPPVWGPQTPMRIQFTIRKPFTVVPTES